MILSSSNCSQFYKVLVALKSKIIAKKKCVNCDPNWVLVFIVYLDLPNRNNCRTFYDEYANNAML
jgi:hypothetical protein